MRTKAATTPPREPDNVGDYSGEGIEVQSLAVAVQILDLLASRRTRVSAAEIARSLGMTPPRVWRHLKSMQALGLVEVQPGERGFVLGGRLVYFGRCAADGMNVTEVAYTHLVELRDAVQETVYLVVPHGDGGTVVLSLSGTAPISLNLAVGTYFAGHSSASGRVLTAFSSAEHVRRMLRAPLDPHATPNPIVDPAALKRRLALVRKRFYDTAETRSVQRTSGTVFINGIAAPVFDGSNTIAGAVGLLTGLEGEPAISDPAILQPLFRCVADISASLGASVWRDSGLVAARGPAAED